MGCICYENKKMGIYFINDPDDYWVEISRVKPYDLMKLIYAADIHGAFEKVKTLLYETIADVYIIAGDLIDIPFYNMEMAIRYHELQTYFHGLRGGWERPAW